MVSSYRPIGLHLMTSEDLVQVAELKDIISRELRFPTDRLKLVRKGKALEDNNGPAQLQNGGALYCSHHELLLQPWYHKPAPDGGLTTILHLVCQTISWQCWHRRCLPSTSRTLPKHPLALRRAQSMTQRASGCQRTHRPCVSALQHSFSTA